MTIRHAVVVVGVLAGAALAAPAQDPPRPKTTPTTDALAAAGLVARAATTANVVPATFRAQLVVDNRFPPKEKKDPIKDEDRDPRDRTGKIHCLVCEYGLSPTVAIFVRSDIKGLDATRGLGKLINQTDMLIPKYRGDKMAAFAMFLKLEGKEKVVTINKGMDNEEKVVADKEYPDDEKRDEYAQEIRAFAAAAKADKVPFGLAPTTSESIRKFGLTDGVPVTVIIYNRLRMVQRWEFQKLDEITDAKITEILDATERMIGVVPQKKKE